MHLGYTHDGEERHLFEFDDGCTLVVDGIDRTDAQAKADADHEDCTLHTEPCRTLNRLMQSNLSLTLHCQGECNAHDVRPPAQLWASMTPARAR